jgi:hypothetical protein
MTLSMVPASPLSNRRTMNRRIAGLIIAMSMVLVALVAQPAAAGPPGGVCAAPVDELGFASRDGFDFFHVSNPTPANSLADLEGYLNTCHTNDSLAVEAVSGSARALRVSGVVRIQLRAQLQKRNASGVFVTQTQSASVNTGVNRTLEVTTGRLTETGSAPVFTPGWFRVNVRALVRYGSSTGPLVFYERQTYPVWLGDGPVSPVL